MTPATSAFALAWLGSRLVDHRCQSTQHGRRNQNAEQPATRTGLGQRLREPVKV
ncbi:MAG: hypothetical protein QM692_08145 [Thermomicrobiales bacterium]